MKFSKKRYSDVWLCGPAGTCMSHSQTSFQQVSMRRLQDGTESSGSTIQRSKGVKSKKKETFGKTNQPGVSAVIRPQRENHKANEG